MIPRSFLLIETDKFPALPGEDAELVNPGLYGKALCRYLEAELPKAGIEVLFFCNEDWGWWVEVVRGGFKMGLLIHSDPEADGDPRRYVLAPDIQKARRWSWSRFRMVDVSRDVLALMDAVESVFANDSDIAAVSRHDDYPL